MSLSELRGILSQYDTSINDNYSSLFGYYLSGNCVPITE